MRAVVASVTVQPKTSVAKPRAAPAAPLLGAMAAVLLAVSPANAGVVFEKQPALKNFVTPTEAAAPVKSSAAAPAASKAAPAPKAEKKAAEASEGSDGIDPRAIALPASIVGVAALGVVGSKTVENWDEFIENAFFKKSDVLGAGYEPSLKAEGGPKGTLKKTASNKKKFF